MFSPEAQKSGAWPFPAPAVTLATSAAPVATASVLASDRQITTCVAAVYAVEDEWLNMRTVYSPRSATLRRTAGGLLAVVALIAFASPAAGAGRCFLRNGDRWSILGDSITLNGGYVRTIRRVLNHFHPDADIDVNGIGVDGVQADYEFSAKSTNATVVSIMLGTNNAIHVIDMKDKTIGREVVVPNLWGTGPRTPDGEWP